MSDEKRKWLGVPVQNIPMSWVLRHCEGAARQGVSIEAVLRDSLIEPFYGDDRDQVSFDQFGISSTRAPQSGRSDHERLNESVLFCADI